MRKAKQQLELTTPINTGIYIFDFLKYQPKNITGEITVEEVYKEKGIILSFNNLSWTNSPNGGTIYNLTGKLAFTYPNYNPLANK